MSDTGVGAGALKRDEGLSTAVERACAELLDSLHDLRDLERVASDPDDNIFASIAERAGLTQPERTEFDTALGELAAGIQKVVSNADDDGRAFRLAVPNNEVAAVLFEALRSGISSVRKRGVDFHARRGGLILAAAAFETFIAALARTLLRHRPQLVAESTIRLGQLDELGSLESGRAYVIDREVEALMRGGNCRVVKVLREVGRQVGGDGR